MSEAVKAVLFDLDNTLIDWRTAGNWSDTEHRCLTLLYNYLVENDRPLSGSVNRFMMRFNDLASDAWEGARATLRAPHIINTMEATLAEFGFIPDDEISMRDVMIAYDWGDAPGVVPFPDVPGALQKLLDDGIKIGIVTNAWQPMWLRDAELEHHNLMQYFPQENLRISAADVGYLKPHPNIFKHALQQIGTKPENTLFVGDNPTADIGGAQKVGMRAILRLLSEEAPLISSVIVPDASIRSFDELLLLVENWDTHISDYQL